MSASSHLIHFILTILFFPWAIVWLCCAISAGNSRRKQERMIQERQLAALEEMARVNKYRGWSNDK